MSSSKSNATKQNPSAARVKGGRKKGGGGLVDAAPPSPAPAAAAARAVPPMDAAAGSGPDFKDQARSVPPPAAAAASNRPANDNEDYGPDFKDQVRSATPPPDAAKQDGEEENSTADEPHDPQPPPQHQEPQAALGGNAQEPSVVAFAHDVVPIDGDTEALAGGGGVANQQMMVLRKHRIWAAVAVVLGTVVAVVVAVVLTNNSDGGGSTPTSIPTGPPTDIAVLLENTKLTASDGAASDQFGFSVAIAGDTMVVGARMDDVNGLGSGSAYVFTRTGTAWVEQAKLTASDGAAGDLFGESVAIAGDTIVVGAPLMMTMATDSGSAYVFTHTGTTWTEQAKLTVSDGAASDQFGYSVAIAGVTIVVGAYNNDDNGTDSGSAYVFTRTGTAWMEQAKLTASDAAAGDLFGWSVAIDGDTIVVGALRGDDDNGEDSGSAYVYTRTGTTWTEQAKLTASDGAAGDQFGWSVAIDGDTIVVGANLDDDNGPASGSAYVFTRTGTALTQQTKLTASNGAGADRFGISVAIAGDTIVVGTNEDVGPEKRGSGSAYVFIYTGVTWIQQVQLTVNDATVDNEFGLSVTIANDTIVVGAYNADNDGSTNSGSAYTYDLN